MFDSPWLIPLLAVGTIVVALTFLLVRRGNQFRKALQDAATELGLSWSASGRFGPGTVAGVYRHQPVHIHTRVEGIGSFARLMTVVEIDFDPPIPIEFELQHENVLTKIRRVFGQPDLEFGDPEFDKLYRVRSPHPEAMQRLFSAATRAALVTMAKGSADFDVNPTRIFWEQTGRVDNPKTLVRVVKAGVAAAASIRAALPRAPRHGPVVDG